MYAQDVVSLGLQTETITAIAIDPKNPNTIYAGSSSNFSSNTFGMIFKSTNQGITWDTLYRGVSVTDIKIHPIDNTILYAALEVNVKSKSVILKSTDAGLSWSKADSGITANSEVWVQQIVFVKQNTEMLYCYTSGNFSGSIYATMNGGKVWTKINESPHLAGNLHDLIIEGGDSLKLLAINNALENLVRSNDSGKSWIEIPLNKPLANILRQEDSTNNLFALVTDTVGKPTIVYKSGDHGNTWTEIPGEIPDSLYPVEMVILNRMNKEDKLVIANKYLRTYVYASSDNIPWVLKSVFPMRFTTMIYHPEGYLLATGLTGIYKIGGITSVSRGNNPALYTMAFSIKSIYPNPFNPSTRITFELSHSSQVKLVVYDMLGREMTQLVSDEKEAGQYSVMWNASSFAAGVYLARMSAGDYSEVKKLILLK